MLHVEKNVTYSMSKYALHVNANFRIYMNNAVYSSDLLIRREISSCCADTTLYLLVFIICLCFSTHWSAILGPCSSYYNHNMDFFIYTFTNAMYIMNSSTTNKIHYCTNAG